MRIYIIYFMILFISNCFSTIGGLKTEVSRKNSKVYFVFQKNTVVDRFEVMDNNSHEYFWELHCANSVEVDSGTRIEYGTPFAGCIVIKNEVKPLKKFGSYDAYYSGPSVIFSGLNAFSY